MKENIQFNNITAADSQASAFPPISGDGESQPTEIPALSHTGIEQLLYELMFAATRRTMTKAGAFSTRNLMIETGIHDYSSLRRAQIGLINKMSIERQKPDGNSKSPVVVYVVYSPSEIIARRRAAGFTAYPKDLGNGETTNPTAQVIERIAHRHNLSRRQAQVALKCAEGLSNAEIGANLLIRQETVKFHLRNIFIKFGVKRRTELIAHLFQRELTGLIGTN